MGLDPFVWRAVGSRSLMWRGVVWRERLKSHVVRTSASCGLCRLPACTSVESVAGQFRGGSVLGPGGDEPRQVFGEIAQPRLVDVILPTRTGIETRKRRITRPTRHQAVLLQRLGLHLPKQAGPQPANPWESSTIPSDCGSWATPPSPAGSRRCRLRRGPGRWGRSVEWRRASRCGSRSWHQGL